MLRLIDRVWSPDSLQDRPVSQDPPRVLSQFRQKRYGGRAYANSLAAAGFAVLVHDVFLWGSRRFRLETMPDRF